MKQCTMKIDADLMARIQNLKAAYFDRYHKTITISEVIQRVFDKDPVIMALLK